jgi:hypothetical protein
MPGNNLPVREVSAFPAEIRRGNTTTKGGMTFDQQIPLLSYQVLH